MMLTREMIIEALGCVKDPVTGRNVIEAKLVSGIVMKNDGKVGFLITVEPAGHQGNEGLRDACEKAVAALPGVTSVTAVLTAERQFNKTDPSPAPVSSAAGSARPKAVWNSEPLANVRRIIAVASGKGGVGKSTTAVNLSHALAGRGLNVGLLDADVTGPSLPRMMALKSAPEVKDGKIVPLVSYGIQCMSMGLLVGESSALVWRGPQLSKALSQMLRGVTWGLKETPLDILLIDMPPGTGDINLSLVQQVPVSGVIIITTPQEVAVADARKCIDMFRKVNVPVLGVIENMSGFADPATGKIHAIFGSGGGRRLADEQNAPFLGEVPLEMAIGTAAEGGERFEDKDRVYDHIAAQLKITG